jgi:hypothetical protein
MIRRNGLEGPRMSMQKRNRAIAGLMAFAALATASAAPADVKAGVDAWSKGDYAAAVHEWEGPAAAGDADAMFNLAQAYRLGRGVSQDVARAEELYAKAAAKGHIEAADTYGLMLFQDGRREAALPYIEAAAGRGDPRSEYLLGVATFNGDSVAKDWVKGYALVSLANAQGLPQATAALAQMDAHIPLAQRQQAASLALKMQQQATARRAQQLASADLATRAGAAPSAPASRPVAPHPEKTAVSPSAAAALAAVNAAREATGAERPAAAGAGFATRSAPAPKLASAPPATTTRAVAQAVESKPKPTALASSSEGPWKVQLGVFSVRGNVDRLWAQVGGRGELAGKTKVTVPAGAATKLQAGGFASRDAAEAACRALRHAGHDCLVTR